MTKESFIVYNGRMSTKWQRRKDQRPVEILTAALGLFVSKGFAATKIDDIAKQAKVSKGTVYLYFESKDELFKKMVHEIMVPKISEVEEYIATYQGSQIELLKLVIRRWWKTIKASGLIGIPKLIISEADKFPDLTRFYMKEVIHRIQSVLVNILVDGIKSNELRNIEPVLSARVIMSSLVYFSMWDVSLKKYDRKDLNVEDLIEQQISILVNGIQK